MSAFQWKSDYSVGHATIDAQHGRIIDILNRLHDLLNVDAGVAPSATAGDVFDQLAEYVMTHFAYEEQLMADSGYPVERVADHRRQHDNLLSKVQEIMNAFDNGDAEVLAELLPYLYGDWLIEHICKSDRDYAPFITQPG